MAYHVRLSFYTVMSCSAPDNATNAVKRVTKLEVGGTVTYVCLPGYNTSDAVVRECLTSGVWSGSVPTCNSK